MIINKEIAKQHNIYCSPNEKFILAVSGGPDSQCLLKAFPHVVGPEKCLAVGVNHGLREAADSELDLAENLAKSVDVQFRRIRLQIPDGPNLQSRARDERYLALRKERDSFKASLIVTAHHFNDRAETLFMKLIRGKEPRTLPMRVLYRDLFRPFLYVPKEDIIKYLNHWNVQYAHDPSNANQDFLRVWVRENIFPQLLEKDPQVIAHLNKFADFLSTFKTENEL